MANPLNDSFRGALIGALLGMALGPGNPPSARAAEGTQAFPASDFLNSIGVNSAINRRGESLDKTVECARYLGVRWFRSGIEDCHDLNVFIDLHRRTGARFSWSPGSGGSDLERLLATAREMAAADALLSFEGPNEPNNWGVTYAGEKGGGEAPSWLPVARLQAALYQAVKNDPVLRRYPVWSISEGGAERDNVGLQYLVIPSGTDALLSAGTQFADAANVHNYIYHPNASGLEDNKTWMAAEPGPACRVDGLYGEYGRTWGKHFAGYSPEQLVKLPRVTTETGAIIDGAVTEDVQALNLMSMYLDQFKRGWSHTAIYLMRDRVDEAGNQKFGFYAPDYTARKAAVYLHNLTTILADPGARSRSDKLAYAVDPEPSTVHDLLLQKGNGAFELVVWDEQVQGSTDVVVKLAHKTPKVEVYDPTVGTTPVTNYDQTLSVPLTLNNHPIVLTLPKR